MRWISKYQLFLFDFDGLLVDTEKLHYQAYIKMCAQRGFTLNWNFARYSEAAHHGPTDLRDQIYAEFPSLHTLEPDWNVLYQEKKNIFLDLITKENVPLMQGVKELLDALAKANIKRCVVTHSAATLINGLRKQNPLLNSIPHWITREDYTKPKPDPECYQFAIHKLAQPGDNIIGFEDSPRGFNALIATQAKPVLVCPSDSVYLKTMHEQISSVRYFPSFDAISDDNAP